MVYLAAFGLAPESWMAVSTASICLASSGTSRSDLLGLWPTSKVSTLVPPTSMVTTIGVEIFCLFALGSGWSSKRSSWLGAWLDHALAFLAWTMSWIAELLVRLSVFLAGPPLTNLRMTGDVGLILSQVLLASSTNKSLGSTASTLW